MRQEAEITIFIWQGHIEPIPTLMTMYPGMREEYRESGRPTYLNPLNQDLLFAGEKR
jgi:hypothetical protein